MSTRTETIHVRLNSRSYPIQIGRGSLASVAEFIAPQIAATHVVLITDRQVEQPHALAVAANLSARNLQVDVLAVEAGERSKSIEVLANVWDKMLELGANRKTLVVAVGGGVVGDLAGFAASTFARGLPLVQIPTTLLAQVDSAIGGKVGINLEGAKNMVGAIWQPLCVLIDTETLSTLPDRQFRSGLAEVVKYGVILDGEFFAYLERNVAGLCERRHDILQYVIACCCRLEAAVVEADEREESGGRAVLNYGHTIGHALEAIAGYGTFSHGEAVSIGMVCAARLAERRGMIGADAIERQAKLLTALGLPIRLPDVDHAELLAAMTHDKKSVQGRPRFILPTRIGQVELVGDIDPDEVRAALDG